LRCIARRPIPEKASAVHDSTPDQHVACFAISDLLQIPARAVPCILHTATDFNVLFEFNRTLSIISGARPLAKKKAKNNDLSQRST